MLMSDVTYLMDESLSKLSEIHQIQTEMNNQAAWEQQTPVSIFLYFLSFNSKHIYSNNVKKEKEIFDLLSVRLSPM